MNFRTLLIILFLSWCAPAVCTMTLTDCQTCALQNSEYLGIAEMEILIEKEKIREIQGINMPKLSAEGDVTRRDKHPGSNAPSDITRNPPHSNRSRKHQEEENDYPEQIKTISGRKVENRGKVSLIVPIYDCGLVSNKVKSQEYIVQASEHGRQRIEQTLLQEVASSYFTILESQKIRGVVLQSIETLTKQKEIAEDLFSVGLNTKHDILSVNVQLSQRQQELIQAKNNIETAKSSLNRLMGRTLDSSLEIQDVSEENIWRENYNSLIQTSDLCHPDVKKIEAEQTALSYDYQSIQAEHLPKVEAFVDYNASSDRFLLHRHWLSGGIGIRIPLIDGGIVASKLEQKKKEMAASDLRLKQKKEDVHLDIKKAYLNTDAAYSKIPVAFQAILEAEENVRMITDQYQEGLISSDDVLNDEERLAEARASYYQAIYQFYKAKSDLEYAAGRINLKQNSVCTQ